MVVSTTITPRLSAAAPPLASSAISIAGPPCATSRSAAAAGYDLRLR
jgi:hypothetical protein